jgi:UDP-glucose 4-epimerase
VSLSLLITGGTGFVGRALVKRLGEKQVSLASRSDSAAWHNALVGITTVVHLAARVHVMRDTEADPMTAFRAVNVVNTLSLARQAATAGITRLVFISSVKVNGEATELDRPYTADDEPAPLDPYGISKMEAEQGLRKIAAETGMEVVIIRPPLVYGPGVKANFQSLMRLLVRGMPLPFGAINNRRSMVSLDNLVDLIVTCIDHPSAANQTFLVSDGEDLSTTQLLQRLGRALGTPARLIPIPVMFLKVGAALVGKPAVAQRLCGSLQVDISKTRQLLGWTPPLTVDEGLKRAAEGYLHEASL